MSQSRTLDENFKIDASQVCLQGKTIGFGSTGQVFEGLYNNKKVAVKTYQRLE